MQHIKDDKKKSKVVLYVLKDRSGEIVDVSREEKADKYYIYNGNIVSYDELSLLVPDYWKRREYEHQRKLTTDYGYEEVKKFIFRTGFKVCGSGGSWSGADLMHLSDVNGAMNPNKNKASEYGITVGNLYEYFELAGKGGDFSIDTVNGEVVLNGVWEFDCNKSRLCVMPYTGN